MKKQLWKQVTAFVIACAVVVPGTSDTNTALAAENENNIAAASLPKKTVKDNDITKTERQGENTPELNKILEECEAVEQEEFSHMK